MEHIIRDVLSVLVFIVLVIQTIRLSYFKRNFKEERNFSSIMVDLLNHKNIRITKLHAANAYLRSKMDRGRRNYNSLDIKYDLLDKENKKNQERIKQFDTSLQEECYRNVELKNRVRELEAAIANTSVEPKPNIQIITKDSKGEFSSKPLNTALDEMNKTADKEVYVNHMISPLPSIHEVLKRYDAIKGINHDYEHQIMERLNERPISRASEMYKPYFGGNAIPPENIHMNEDEDQYNTTAEDNEEDNQLTNCTCTELNQCNNCKRESDAYMKHLEEKYPEDKPKVLEIERMVPFASVKDCKCDMCETGRILYEEWRIKQKSGHRKESNEA